MNIRISSPITEESFRRKVRNFDVSPIIKISEHYPSASIADDEKLDSIYEWCEANLGDDWIWSNPTQTDYVKLWFKTEYDALVFKLKFNTI